LEKPSSHPVGGVTKSTATLKPKVFWPVRGLGMIQKLGPKVESEIRPIPAAKEAGRLGRGLMKPKKMVA
jgi:hypothetical protein